MTEKKTEQMEKELAAADKRLHDIQDQMRVPNEIRAMIEAGKTTDDIYDHVISMIKVGVNIKEDALREIQKCHLELAKRHMKLTESWQFVWIGQKGVDV